MNPFWHEKKFDNEHLLGTDKVGRDYLSRLMYGAQISLLIGFSSMLISGLIGTAMGVTAGYFGGRVDMVVNFIINLAWQCRCSWSQWRPWWPLAHR